MKYSEAKALLKLSEEKKVSLFVEFHKRYDRQLRFARDTFKEGKLGIPYILILNILKEKKYLFHHLGHGVRRPIFSYLGVHYIDALFVTGAKPLRVLSTGQKFKKSRFQYF